MRVLQQLEWPIFFILFAALLWVGQPAREKSGIYEGDDLRYISYAVSLHEYGVFGLLEHEPYKAPSPGNANAPLYPFMMAGMMAVDNAFADSLVCVAREGPDAGCEENFQRFFMVKIASAVLCLFLIYQTAFRFSDRRVMGWLTAFLAFGAGILSELSFVFMTEILILPAFAALCLFHLLFYQTSKMRWVIAIAVTLAVLTLIRPSYLYLFYGYVLFFVGMAVLKRNRAACLRVIALALVFVMTVSPWAMRNKAQFDSYTLTSGGYAEAILMQRVHYNQMRWAEIGVAMVYWLPDFGDSLAQKIFPEDLYRKLNWDAGSYSSYGYGEYIQKIADKIGGREKVLKHLILEEVLTPKHVAVSIPLAMRGSFIAKYWGLVGFVAFVLLLIQTIRKRDYSVAVIALPLFFMVAFHAGLSVSIPRYNMPLITLYALSMAWYIKLYGCKLFKTFRHE